MPNIQDFYVRYHTQSDDKDAGEAVSVAITANDGTVRAELSPVGLPSHTWNDHTDQPDASDSSYGGKRGWFKLLKQSEHIYGVGAKLAVGKTGDSGWEFTVDVMVTVGGEEHI